MPAALDVLDDIMARSREEQEVLRVHLNAVLDGDVMPGAGIDWSSEVRARLEAMASGTMEFLEDDEIDAILDDESEE